jgi:hypothetical protein
MCYHLFLASPLTLSEIRAMLPPGLTADLLVPAQQSALKRIFPAARTSVRLLRGACSCDLVVERLGHPREDEAHLRRRFRSLALPRDRVIRSLDRHRLGRAGEGRRSTPPSWREALAAFVAEHARNAGPSLYLLQFSPDEAPAPASVGEGAPFLMSASEVRARAETWLDETRPVVVRP